MVTKEQAMNETQFHYGNCTKTEGPKGGVKLHIEHWRASGQCTTWKTRPLEFRLPVKYGLYENAYIDHRNANMFHVASECPVRES